MMNRYLTTGKIFFTAMFLFCSVSFHMAADDSQPRKYSLPWIMNENALRYEIVIQKETEDGRYVELPREFAESSPLAIFLVSGAYQYRVIPYNKMNQPDYENGSKWKQFTVAHSSSVFLEGPKDEDAQGFEYVVEQKEGEGYLELIRKFTEESSVEINLLSGFYRYHVISHYLRNRRVGGWVNFEIPAVMETPLVLNYEPETNTNDTVIDEPEHSAASAMSGSPAYTKPVDIYLEAAPVLFLFWGSLKDYFGTFGNPSIPIGFKFKFDIVWWKSMVGAELTVSQFFLTTANDQKITAPLTIFDVNVSLSVPLVNQTVIISFPRIGFGLAVGKSGVIYSQEESNNPSRVTGHFNAGFSFLMLMRKYMYIETGADISVFWGWSSSLGLRPWIGAGIRY